MAGSYPDAPSNRMVLDRDGTQIYRIDSFNQLFQLSAGDVQTVNDETSNGFSTGTGGVAALTPTTGVTLVVLFPEKRNVLGYYLNAGVAASGDLAAAEVSTNTTNGVDGTWTAVTAVDHNEAVSPGFRSKIQAINALGVRGIRFRWIGGASTAHPSVSLHLYGVIAAGESPHRLEFWHPTSDARIGGAYFDWGDTPRSSSADRSVRVKNVSTTKTAHDVEVSFNALTDGIPSVTSQFTVSENAGVSFTASVELGSIAPGGFSPVLVVRRNTTSEAALSVWEPRIVAVPGNWTG